MFAYIFGYISWKHALSWWLPFYSITLEVEKQFSRVIRIQEMDDF